MTDVLRTMIEAIVAELDRQNSDLTRNGDTLLSSYEGASIDVEKVAQAALLAISDGLAARLFVTEAAFGPAKDADHLKGRIELAVKSGLGYDMFPESITPRIP